MTEKANSAKSEEQALAKANEAIAIRPKRGKLTLLSRRIYNALLYHSQRQGVDLPAYTLPLSELINDARFNSNNTEVLKSHLRDMQATTIEWSTSGSGQKKWTSTQLIGTVTIEEPGRGRPCVITWHYPDEIRERLLRPNQYTRVLLEISARMRSYSAAVLYEIGARYLTSPGRLTMREDVIWWAAVLTGRSDITTIDYRFFKRDVITKALVEVEALCEDFTLELIEHKRGRRIEEIQFRVVPKAQRALHAMQDAAIRNVFDLKIIGRMVTVGLKQEDAQDLYARTDEGELRAALDYVEQRMRSNSLAQLKSPAAYLCDAIKKGYTLPSAAPAQRIELDRNVTPMLAGPEGLKKTREVQQNDRWARARAFYESMAEEQKARMRSEFEIDCLATLPAPIARSWRRDGSIGRVISSLFYEWVVGRMSPSDSGSGIHADVTKRKEIIKSD